MYQYIHSIFYCVYREAALKPHVLWFDNFDFRYRGIMPTFSKETFTQFNWTGVAIRPYHGHTVENLTIEHDLHGFVHAMPEDLLGTKDIVCQELMTIVDEGQLYLDKSLVHKFKVNCVPLTLEVEEEKHPRWFRTLSSHADGLIHLLPKEILDIPIGTNISLIPYIHELCGPGASVPVTDSSVYQIISTDMNIYQRINKVIYILTYLGIVFNIVFELQS
jgi:hypothetical protein